MECNWFEEQNHIKRENVDAKIAVAVQNKENSSSFFDDDLERCKLHGGLMNSSEEIQCLTYKPPMQLELLYRLLTHEQDYNLRPQL